MERKYPIANIKYTVIERAMEEMSLASPPMMLEIKYSNSKTPKTMVITKVNLFSFGLSR